MVGEFVGDQKKKGNSAHQRWCLLSYCECSNKATYHPFLFSKVLLILQLIQGKLFSSFGLQINA